MLIIARDIIADTASCVIRCSCMGTIEALHSNGKRYVLERYSPPIVAREVFHELKSTAKHGGFSYKLPDSRDVSYTWELGSSGV